MELTLEAGGGRREGDCEKAMCGHPGKGNGSREERVGRASEIIAWFQSNARQKRCSTYLGLSCGCKKEG